MLRMKLLCKNRELCQVLTRDLGAGLRAGENVNLGKRFKTPARSVYPTVKTRIISAEIFWVYALPRVKEVTKISQ